MTSFGGGWAAYPPAWEVGHEGVNGHWGLVTVSGHSMALVTFHRSSPRPGGPSQTLNTGARGRHGVHRQPSSAARCCWTSKEATASMGYQERMANPLGHGNVTHCLAIRIPRPMPGVGLPPRWSPQCRLPARWRRRPGADHERQRDRPDPRLSALGGWTPSRSRNEYRGLVSFFTPGHHDHGIDPKLKWFYSRIQRTWGPPK